MSRVWRFSFPERRLHWVNALSIGLLGTSGAMIWQHVDRLWRPGGINVLAQAHVWLGGGLMLVGLLMYLLSKRPRVPGAEARFNPGQRLNLWFMRLVLPWMLASGVLLYLGKAMGIPKPTRHLIADAHLISAAAIGVMVLGHLAMVLLVPKNRGILAAMLTGTVSREVAARSAPQWLEKAEAEQPKQDPSLTA